MPDKARVSLSVMPDLVRHPREGAAKPLTTACKQADFAAATCPRHVADRRYVPGTSPVTVWE